MSISGIISSPSQRRLLFTLSLLLILLCCIAVAALYELSPDTRGWNVLISFFVGIATSGMLALFSVFYLYFFFADPFDIATASQLLPTDIGAALEQAAASATEYKIYVRTGRHFRASILPLLAKTATRKRVPIRLEVVLLDFETRRFVVSMQTIDRKHPLIDSFGV